jgi:hypothetical protein
MDKFMKKVTIRFLPTGRKYTYELGKSEQFVGDEIITISEGDYGLYIHAPNSFTHFEPHEYKIIQDNFKILVNFYIEKSQV